jgi:hypothetical protein
MKSLRWTLCVVGLILLAPTAHARLPQDPQQDAGGAPAGGGGANRALPDPNPRPYDRVITPDAKTKKGVFTVHQIRSHVFYEIPASELGKDYLWVSLIARTTLGVGYGGQADGNRVVRWEKHGDRIYLRSVSYEIVADDKLPIAQAVHAANNDTILMAFNVDAYSKDGAPVIDVTRLFTTEVPEFSARARLRARAFDASRSFFERVAAYPTNIEVEATHTFTSPIDAAGGGGAPAPAPGGFGGAGMRPGSASVLMHYSMIKLPEKPMQPRIFDERVGYFSITQEDFGQDEHRAPKRTYITRWRLEKKDPSAELSEPVKPIVYYVDPATPEKWRPWVKKAIEDWQPAFEKAGFKNAIIARDAPTPQEDPDWSPEDARYSVVRWLPSTTENAVGPHIADPRSGEVLNADIQLYHNVMNLARDWYFIQVGALDKNAQKLPLSDELMGRLLEYVIAHEVGHTLGFQHNMKSSSLYDAKNVRNAEWVHKMGHVATLMDYSRFNYVAQPEDNIPPADLIPGIGPYDKWATMWGYKPIPSAHSPEEEKKTLDEWAREQDTTPWLRFSTAGAAGSDPGENTEAVGDSDAVWATTMGLKNLHRVMDMLITASTKPGEPYTDLAEIYGRILGQWTLEMGHVAVIPGGIDSQTKYAGQKGVIFTPVPRERQVAAVKFLNDNAFKTPDFFIRPEILERIEPVGVLGRIQTAQTSVLNRVLNNQRLARLVEIEAIDGAKSYHPVEFLADVRHGVWSELDAGTVRIDAYRRNLQRSYVELLNQKLNARAIAAAGGRGGGGNAAANEEMNDEVRPYFRAELRTLSAEIAKALPKVTDAETRLHLDDMRDQIAKALDPKFPPAAPTAAGGGGRGGISPLDVDNPEELGCWPDYIIRH